MGKEAIVSPIAQIKKTESKVLVFIKSMFSQFLFKEKHF